MTDADIPLPYRIDLSGLSLIEASAGTGKTHTLVRLMARHLLWHGLPIERVLAVTFTEAACSELKDRLRTFLTSVSRYLAHETDDGDIQYLLRARPAHVSEAEFKACLLEALNNIDRAAIFTIHGFCQGILRDQPLLAGQAMPAPELLLSEAALYLQISEEFWRRHGQDPETASALQNELQSPQQTVDMLPNLLSLARLMPDKPELPDPTTIEPMPDLAESMQRHAQDTLRAMLLAFEAGAFHKNQFPSAESIQSCFAHLAEFLKSADVNLIDSFGKLAYSRIREIKGKTKPESPVLHDVDRLLLWQQTYIERQQQMGLWLLHELQTFARQRLAELKRQRQVIGFNDMIDSLYFALHAEHGEALAMAVQEAFPVALVDEFQDTDERQWAIFERLYLARADTSLILIGDPKQAIYGFRGGDVHTYLKARAQTKAGRIYCLDVNYRSGPALLADIERVFTAKRAQPFYEPAIQFTPVSPGRKSTEISVDATPWPALQFALIERGNEKKPLPAGRAALRCAELAANSIAHLLNQAQRNNAVLLDANGSRPITSRDIVVLVASHRQAALMQSRLQQLQVASVCVRRDSVFGSYEALDVLNILHALHTPGRPTAQHTAEQGLLFKTCERLGAPPDKTLLPGLFIKQGPLGCLGGVLQTASGALLAMPDGGRRLSNYWQVLELMQNRATPAQGPAEAIDWLSRQISQHELPGDDSESAMPRLESSAERVRIMTLHQSKGLEFGIVFMPFTAISRKPAVKFARYFDGVRRCLAYKTKLLPETVQAQVTVEHESENLRLLYVGMTRAKYALWLSWGDVNQAGQGPLSRLLFAAGDASADYRSALETYTLATDYPALAFTPPRHVETPNVLHVDAVASHQDAWHITSFSGLHRSLEKQYSHAADDEPGAPVDGADTPFKGAAFGNALHAVLEYAETADWAAASPQALQQGALLPCRSALQAFGYTQALAETGAPILAGLVFNTLHGLLPEQLRLLDLRHGDKRHELEFHLRINHAGSDAILALMHRHGYCLQRPHFGFQSRLHGLLTGKIDLLYQSEGRVFILDYKSNLLPAYDQATLAGAMQDSEYDLQYLLYSVAVHRWLKHKLGAAYEFSRTFGGIRYLFVRGMRPGLADGIFCDVPPADLIAGLDACFDSDTKDSHER